MQSCSCSAACAAEITISELNQSTLACDVKCQLTCCRGRCPAARVYGMVDAASVARRILLAATVETRRPTPAHVSTIIYYFLHCQRNLY